MSNEVVELLVSLGRYDERIQDVANPDWRTHSDALTRLDKTAVDAEQVAPVLVPWLNDPAPDRRSDTALWLARFPGATEKAVPALAKMLDDPSLACRGNAAIALGQYGPAADSALPALLKHQNDDFIGDCIRQALRKISPTNSGQ